MFFSAYLWAHAKSNQNQMKRDLFTSHRINALISQLSTNSSQTKKTYEKIKQQQKKVKFSSLLHEVNTTETTQPASM